jgi:hypothetical protein
MPINASMRPQVPYTSVTDPPFDGIAFAADGIGSWALLNATELRLSRNRFRCR